MRLTIRTLFQLLLLLPVLISASTLAAPSSKYLQAERIVHLSAEKIDQFDSTQHWDSVKRLTGVAKAIVIFPSGGQAGFLVGAQWGNGILLTRNDHDWSEPVFVEFNSFMFGLLAGAQSIGGVGVILSDDVLDSMANSPIKVGGTADLTIGKGVSGKVIGGVSGVSSMMVSENRGLYFGGSIDTFQLRLDEDLNQAYYGENFNAELLLTQFDVNKGSAQNLRHRLAGIAYRAVYQ